ncbi:MAG TPA: YetF domain-containing protein [Noviherbaspirillum sp.]|uniref:DUF421 domain-containing protein n=1 Tax=Noviherbaspirillum sp. TaxID=1926288 RepID=UPI002B48C30E|nr:YetF domain-containing protein [Noviherbaspirillum sp.]HJV86042.1 YetF domain-containing protein [Noviherbaspirillum sp.]
MESLSSLDWDEMFKMSVPLGEILIRGTVMYWFLFLMFRFVVRREVGAVGIADILILVIVADAAQNAMAGEYTSVSDGMVLVGTLIGWNMVFDWLSYASPLFRRLAEPGPLRLIENGVIQRRNMRKEFITVEELWGKLREQGVESLSEVKLAFMESDGQISVIKRKK